MKKGTGVSCVFRQFGIFTFIKALDLPFGMAFAVPNFCLSYRNELIYLQRMQFDFNISVIGQLTLSLFEITI